MKTRLLLSTLLLLLSFNHLFSQENNPNFKAPQTWITDDCGVLIQLPTSVFEEFIYFGGYAYSECGITENSLYSYFTTYYDEFLKKITIETIYVIEDSCGNTMECTDHYLFRPTVFTPHDINAVVQIDSLYEIDSITGLPYSPYYSPITTEQFINAGGIVTETCGMGYPELAYTDWDTYYDGNGLPQRFTRTFLVFDPINGLFYEMNQYIDLNNPYSPAQTITILPPNSFGVDECYNPIFPWIFNYQEFVDLGGLIKSECGINESSFASSQNSYYDEFWDKFVISNFYYVEDNCGNYQEYEDAYFFEPTVEIPKNVYSNSACTTDDIEALTGLPYYNYYYSTDITKEQFIAAGGSFKDCCVNQDQYYIQYNDYPNYNQTCPFSFIRSFMIHTPSGFPIHMEQQITVEDLEPPVLTAPTDTVLSCIDQLPEPFSSISEFVQAGGSVSDNCILKKQSFQLINETRNGTCPQTVTRTYEIQDTCGNSATADQVIMIIDENPPAVALAPDIYVECSGDVPPAYANYDEFITAGGLMTDDCGLEEDSFSLNRETITGSSCSKTIQREYRIADNCYNVTYFIQNIYVTDTMPPTISGIPAQMYECHSDIPAPFNYFDFVSAGGQIDDNCYVNHSTFWFVSQTSTGTCPTQIKRIYEVKDSCGNTGTWQHLLTVVDTTAPFFITQPQAIPAIEFGSIFPAFETLEYADNCGIPELSTSVLPYTEDENGYEVTYVWTISDSCGNTAQTSTSFSVLPKPVTYCESYGNPVNEWIRSVSVNNQTSTSGKEGYADFTESFEFEVEAGSVNAIVLTPEFAKKATFLYWRIWIDTNEDGEFTNDELVFSADRKRTAVSGTISIPGGLSTETRMRVAMNESGSPNSCGSVGNGEVEDYKIIITTAEPQPAVAAFSSNKTTITVGESVQFYDESLNNPTWWEWRMPGADIELSAQQNPIATYSSAGTYDILFFARNSVGGDSIVAFNYITVTDPPINTYCESQSLSSSKEWIAEVVLGTINNASGSSVYSDFTSVETSLDAGSGYSISLTPGFSGKSQREFWKVWIDFNQDSDFDDANEEVLSMANFKSTVVGNIQIPADALPGTTRMRIAMKANAFPTACETFDRGEVEDYSVSIATNKSAVVSSVLDETTNNWLIYPNPAHSVLNIQSQSTVPSEISIYQSNGVMVFQKEYLDATVQIDIRNLSDGVYFLQIKTQDDNFTTKFIKQ
ncbi:GEVED domain-containing protein [Maribellus luteus]|nr:GEVED domain-containing protein [Maribellus luteus]